MDQPTNGHGRAHRPGDDIIIEHLARLAAQLSAPCQAHVITTGKVPYLRVTSEIDPDLTKEVLCDFSTDPPDYLTVGGQRLGIARSPEAAAACLRRLLHATGTEGT